MALKTEIGVQSKHVHVRVKSKNGKIREQYLTKEIEGLIRKKEEAYVRYGKWLSSKSFKVYRGYRREHKKTGR